MQQSTKTGGDILHIHPHLCISRMLCSGLYVMFVMLELGLLFENVVRRQAAAGDAYINFESTCYFCHSQAYFPGVGRHGTGQRSTLHEVS